ncbi:hypothetical protein HBB16_18140 [Pseudonocardia sp. MCCB 268]|nr:hypothetical protein [Pseudonocardia cytotoxica]
MSRRFVEVRYGQRPAAARRWDRRRAPARHEDLQPTHARWAHVAGVPAAADVGAWPDARALQLAVQHQRDERDDIDGVVAAFAVRARLASRGRGPITLSHVVTRRAAAQLARPLLQPAHRPLRQRPTDGDVAAVSARRPRRTTGDGRGWCALTDDARARRTAGGRSRTWSAGAGRLPQRRRRVALQLLDEIPPAAVPEGRFIELSRPALDGVVSRSSRSADQAPGDG